MDHFFKKINLELLSSEEAAKLSCLNITNYNSINRDLGKPVNNGPYDGLLGPTDTRAPCKNCKLSYSECNGHFGNVEFPKPIYHPVTFENLYKFIKGICFGCHRFFFTNGVAECFKLLGHSFDGVTYRYDDIDNLSSLTKQQLREEVLRRMGSTPRSVCIQCGARSLIFKKCRKIEIIIQESKRQRIRGDFDPEAKRRKLNDDTVDINNVKSDETNLVDPNSEHNVILPEILHEKLRKVWDNESKLIRCLFPLMDRTSIKYPTDLFFKHNLIVNPNMNRPPAYQHGEILEDPETSNICMIVKESNVYKDILKIMHVQYEEADKKFKLIPGTDDYEKIREITYKLQLSVNMYFDSERYKNTLNAKPGLRQVVDKKDGMIRSNIMGKRVNFACRSVITPDPNLGLNEVGVPKVFLKKLTFPEKVNRFNKDYLLKCVKNGPEVYPGAQSYQIDDSFTRKLTSNFENVASTLETEIQAGKSVTVYRHANDTDYLIMNRQPTLHKPSMQAHKINPIPDENAKTLRMHYSNCKAYNADFDGDEMNGHYPQTRAAQIEAAKLMNACYQHSTAKDGTPLSGLIQDHVISGTKLSMRNCFLTYHQYLDIVGKGLAGNYVKPLRTLKPAIWKPQKLYTGKQVISTLILNTLPVGTKLPNIHIVSKTKHWEGSNGDNLNEFHLIIDDGYVCCGIFDKNHVGSSAKGLLIQLRELYGDEMTSAILTSFSRAFNAYLTYTGFTISLKDGQLNENGQDHFHQLSPMIKKLSGAFARKALNIPISSETEISNAISKAYYGKSKESKDMIANLERVVRGSIPKYFDKFIQTCQENIKYKFPENNLLKMVWTGSKGGDSNVKKIAIAVGSIEIEGKRCPMTISGRTLPKFGPFQMNLKARGFCFNSFYTGLTPEELFFESMAGRDGLVDTAVKTSNSGYLQRCLVKQLEDVIVKADGSVRDSNNNLIQSKYGGDGFDVIKSLPFNKCGFMELYIRNIKHLKNKYHLEKPFPAQFKLPSNIEERINDVIKQMRMSGELKIKKRKRNDIREILRRKVYSSLVDCGESVGLLAAQSIGEPSTQMTLNTFHNVGQSEMNVTLGIPRLKEIMQVGSERMRISNMELPINNDSNSLACANVIKSKFNKLTFKDVLELPLTIKNKKSNICIVIKLKKRSEFGKLTDKSNAEILEFICTNFIGLFAKKLDKEKNKLSIQEMVENEGGNEEEVENDDKQKKVKNDVEEDDDDNDDDDEDDGDKNGAKDDEEEESEKDDEMEVSDLSDIDNEKNMEVDDDDSDNSNEVTQLTGVSKYFVNYVKKDDRVELILKPNIENCDYLSILLNLIESVYISNNKTIEKAFVSKDNVFCTDGFSRDEVVMYDEIFDLSRLYTNNFVKMEKMYGIDAAKAAFQLEVVKVFKPYNITIDKRHLSLIGDFVTRTGEFKVFNRHAIKCISSDVQRFTFETAISSMINMIMNDSCDNMISPSACIFMGQVIRMGTNSVDVLLDRDAILELENDDIKSEMEECGDN